MERLGLATMPAVLIGVSFAVLSFRVVRRQYGAMLAAQPEVAKGPPRIVLLGLCGVVLAAAGAFLVPAGLRLGVSETGLVEGVVLMFGGFGLVTGCGFYYRGPGRLYRSVPVRRVRIAGGARYVRREIGLTVAPWLALAAAALWIALAVPGLDWRVALAIGAVAWISILIFQFSPHVLKEMADASGPVRQEAATTWLLQDGLTIASLSWLIVASAQLGLADGRSRLEALIPPVLGLCAALAAKIYEKDALRRRR